MKFRIIAIATFAILALATTSQAALNAYLQLKNTKTGDTFKCQLDTRGKFTFKDVPPGTYELSIRCDEEYYTALTSGDHKSEIQLAKWDLKENKGNARMGGDPIPGIDVRGVATTEGDPNRDVVGRKNGALHAADFKRSGNEYYKIVLEDVVISNLSSPTGQIQGMAINEKGLPGEKKPPKGTK